MSRAWDVVIGVCLIVSLWLWMLLSIESSSLHGWGWLFMVCKILTACFITAPVYREYLR